MSLDSLGGSVLCPSLCSSSFTTSLVVIASVVGLVDGLRERPTTKFLIFSRFLVTYDDFIKLMNKLCITLIVYHG